MEANYPRVINPGFGVVFALLDCASQRFLWLCLIGKSSWRDDVTYLGWYQAPQLKICAPMTLSSRATTHSPNNLRVVQVGGIKVEWRRVKCNGLLSAQFYIQRILSILQVSSEKQTWNGLTHKPCLLNLFVCKSSVYCSMRLLFAWKFLPGEPFWNWECYFSSTADGGH